MNFHDPTFFTDIMEPEKKIKIEESILCIALCHTVIVESGNKKYNASSPDELALVSFAKFCGY